MNLWPWFSTLEMDNGYAAIADCTYYDFSTEQHIPQGLLYYTLAWD